MRKSFIPLLTLALGLTACPSQPPAKINGTITLDGSAIATLGASANRHATPTFAPNWNAPRVKGEFLVVVATTTDPFVVQNEHDLQSATALQGATVLPARDGVVRVQVSAGTNEAEVAKRLALETGAVVQPNYRYQSNATPNDTAYPAQTWLPQLGLPNAWNKNTTGVKVAVIDSGIDFDHSELQGRIDTANAKDFCASLDVNIDCVGQDNLPEDSSPIGHGTHVAGIVGANTNNAQGISGVVWQGQILPLKVFHRYLEPQPDGSVVLKAGGGDSVVVSTAIRYAVDRGAKVINMSLGTAARDRSAYDTPDLIVSKALQYAEDNGVVTVASSGNDGSSVGFPASYDTVIAVGSVNAQNLRSGFSAFGPELDLVAPGENILSLSNGGGLKSLTGTSQAAPQVAGIAALMLGANPNLSPARLRGLLFETAKPLEGATRNDQYGHGIPRADLALYAARADTVVHVYADWYANGTAQRSDTRSAALTVLVPSASNTATYSIGTTRTGGHLSAGQYRVVACVDRNADGDPCSTGDDLGTPQIVMVGAGTTSSANISGFTRTP